MASFHSLDEDDFILNYLKDHELYGDSSPFLVHVRIATTGSVCVENCHPFDVPLATGEMAMIHNGMISDMEPAVKGTDMTDSEGLIHNVLSDLYDEWLDNPYLTELVEHFIGFSKLAFIHTNPDLSKDMYILNEDMGVWHEDVWFSNYSAFPFKKATGVSNYKTKDTKYPDGSTCDTNYGYYYNGEYREGTAHQYDDSLPFDQWLIVDDDRRVQAHELAHATHEEHITIFNQSIAANDACPVCTGIRDCLCDDLCYECYEAYHECRCHGRFVSMTQSFTQAWGDRVAAIAASKVGEDRLEVPF